MDSTEPEYIWLAGTAFTRAYAHEAQKEPCLMLGTGGVFKRSAPLNWDKLTKNIWGVGIPGDNSLGLRGRCSICCFGAKGSHCSRILGCRLLGPVVKARSPRDTGQKYSSSQDNIGQLVRPRVFVGPSCHSIWTKDYQ